MLFANKLRIAVQDRGSLLCIGLDPDPQKVPQEYLDNIYEFNCRIIDATWDTACAYKPNVAFYDALPDGQNILKKTIEHIRSVTDVPIIGDSKRGDVRPASEFHAKAMFDVYGFDAATVNPYGGRDAVQPFLDYHDKGIFVWCHSSNPGAGEIQDLEVIPRGNGGRRPLYELIAELAAKWNEDNHNVGLIVGATYPAELKRVRQLCPDMPILIPGVGAQEGDLEHSVAYGVDESNPNIIINVSRSIIYASSNASDFDSAARQVAVGLRDKINLQLDLLVKPSVEAHST